MQRSGRTIALPEQMQGRWVEIDDPTAELVISRGEITCFGHAVNYDFKEVGEQDGSLFVNLGVDDPGREDTFARENITGLAISPEGDLHAYNVKFGATFVRRGPTAN